jgi:starvation-inducible outer membrane lipoprotein
MVKFALLTVLAGALAACASQPDSIQTASVSTVGYDKYNCTQLSQCPSEKFLNHMSRM